MSNSNGFSQNAHLFASSPAHAETEDLDLTLPTLGDPDGRTVLDVATGTGHTAFYFAQLGAHVFAVDINDEMLAVAQEEADRKSLSCRFVKGFAHDLPFDDATFDLVSTRLAAHHFSAPEDFLKEACRVLRSDGQILVIDNVVPEGQAGVWINDYETERDPSHQACLTMTAWTALLSANGFHELTVKEHPKSLDFDLWMRRMSILGTEADVLWDKLTSAPESVTAFLAPVVGPSGRSLTLHRLVIVGKKA
jgi:SAM-dependent methyltransferase